MTRRISPAPAVSPGKRKRHISFDDIVRILTKPASAVIGLAAFTAIYVSLASAPGAIGILVAALGLVMLVIAVIDWRSFIIPDWLNALGLSLAVVYATAQEPESMLYAVVTAMLRGLVLALILLVLRYGYARLRGRQGLGLGDVKLAFVAGAWLDWIMIPLAIEFAAFAALSTYLLRQIISRQSISPTSRMPFGLFFAPAIWLCLVLELRWLELF